jgi:hydroxypyruvate reductase
LRLGGNLPPPSSEETVLWLDTAQGAISAAEAEAARLGYVPVWLGEVSGEARSVGAIHSGLALQARSEGRRVAIMSGGELTVTLGPPPHGSGGPNQEYALALAAALGGAAGVHAIAADTDGCDGPPGDLGPLAGARISPCTLSRATRAGLDPEAALAGHTSSAFFSGIGDAVVTGPTSTNINDFRCVLVDGAS